MMRALLPFALAGALAIALAGCSDEPDATVEFNNSANASAPLNTAAPPPPPPPPVQNAVEEPPVSLDFDDETQMRDDADATGLTARLPREGDDPAPPPPAPAPQPQ